MDKDKPKRDAAVDAFAAAIKARLDEKAAKGYTGWDGYYPSNVLRAEIVNDAAHCYRHESSDKMVDIGARAMMLHFRAAPAAPAQNADRTCETCDDYSHRLCMITGELCDDERITGSCGPDGRNWQKRKGGGQPLASLPLADAWSEKQERDVVLWECPVCGANGTGRREVRFATLPNTETRLRDLSDVDWQCPKCGAWVTPEDEKQDEVAKGER